MRVSKRHCNDLIVASFQIVGPMSCLEAHERSSSIGFLENAACLSGLVSAANVRNVLRAMDALDHALLQQLRLLSQKEHGKFFEPSSGDQTGCVCVTSCNVNRFAAVWPLENVCSLHNCFLHTFARSTSSRLRNNAAMVHHQWAVLMSLCNNLTFSTQYSLCRHWHPTMRHNCNAEGSTPTVSCLALARWALLGCELPTQRWLVRRH